MTTWWWGFSGWMNEISSFRTCLLVFTRLFTDILCSAVWNASVIGDQKQKQNKKTPKHTRQTALSLRNGQGAVMEEGLCPSIAPCPGLEFSLGHSSREVEVSEETLLCPDRLGLQQWLMHNGSTQDRGEVSEHQHCRWQSLPFLSLSPLCLRPVSFSLPRSCQSIFSVVCTIGASDCLIAPHSPPHQVFMSSCTCTGPWGPGPPSHDEDDHLICTSVI